MPARRLQLDNVNVTGRPAAAAGRRRVAPREGGQTRRQRVVLGTFQRLRESVNVNSWKLRNSSAGMILAIESYQRC